MQIVIDIPEELYEAYKGRPPMLGDAGMDMIAQSIANGIPLPKGHGRLIDADELKSMSYEVFVDTDNPNRSDGLSAYNGLVEEDIDLAPTIIEGSEINVQ